MEHEDGFCDDCSAELTEAWLTIDGRALCRGCAIDSLDFKFAKATKPEARDDGR